MKTKQLRQEILKAKNMENYLAEQMDKYTGNDVNVLVGFGYLINLYREKRMTLTNDYKLAVKNATI